MMIKDTSFKNICFVKQILKSVSTRSIQLVFLEFLKQVGSIFESESANVSENCIRIGLLVVILKSPITIDFSYLFDSLRIIASRLVVKSVSLRLGGFYIPATKILFLSIVISIVKISMSKEVSIFIVWLGNLTVK